MEPLLPYYQWSAGGGWGGGGPHLSPQQISPRVRKCGETEGATECNFTRRDSEQRGGGDGRG